MSTRIDPLSSSGSFHLDPADAIDPIDSTAPIELADFATSSLSSAATQQPQRTFVQTFRKGVACTVGAVPFALTQVLYRLSYYPAKLDLIVTSYAKKWGFPGELICRATRLLCGIPLLLTFPLGAFTHHLFALIHKIILSGSLKENLDKHSSFYRLAKEGKEFKGLLHGIMRTATVPFLALMLTIHDNFYGPLRTFKNFREDQAMDLPNTLRKLLWKKASYRS